MYCFCLDTPYTRSLTVLRAFNKQPKPCGQFRAMQPASRTSSVSLACLVLGVLLVSRGSSASQAGVDLELLVSVLDGALSQLEGIAARRVRPDGSGGGEDHPNPIPPDAFPNSTSALTGEYEGSIASKWTAGYLAGCYFRAYMMTGDEQWADLGTAELPGLIDVAEEIDSHKGSHIFDSSFGEALAAAAPGTPVKEYQQVMQTAAASLAARFNPTVGTMQSWKDMDGEAPFETIIDSMASLKIMWEAAAMPGGKQKWADIAMKHAKKVATEIFRPDGSTYHVIRFNRDTGEVELKRTHQGYSDNSTWSRGQAWAVVGFTHVYKITGDPTMLMAARRAANYFIRRLAEADDGVPLWDFDVPPGANMSYKDTSAAAIAASGMLRLGELTGYEKYTTTGIKLVEALASKYLGWQLPGQQVESVLRNGTFNVPFDHHSTGLIWGDWYFMDALSQLLLAANGTSTDV